MIVCTDYRIESKGDRVALHLRTKGETVAILDVSLDQWSNMWRAESKPLPPMNMWVDHVTVMGPYNAF